MISRPSAPPVECLPVVCCTVASIVFLLFAFIPYRDADISELHWTSICPDASRRELHGHGGHGGHHSSHIPGHYYSRAGSMSSIVRVASPVSILAVGFALADSHRYTHIYGCGSFQYNTTDTFFVTHYNNNFGPQYIPSCSSSFNSSRDRDIWIIYPTNGTLSLSTCGHNFILDSNFQFYKDVVVDEESA